jgi:hypothetical protein
LLNVGNREHFCYFSKGRCPFPGSLAQDQALETPTLEQPEEFEHDHDNDNHSNYVKNVSIHAGDSYQIARAKVNIHPNLSAITAFSLQQRFA